MLFYPRTCLLSFIEAASVSIAWLSVLHGSDPSSWVACTDAVVVVINSYYSGVFYPIFITILELSKVLVRGALLYKSEKCPEDCFMNRLLGLSYFIRLDLIFRFLFVLIGQAVIFILSIFPLFGYPFFWINSGYADLKRQWDAVKLKRSKVKASDVHWRWVVGYVGVAVFLFILVAIMNSL